MSELNSPNNPSTPEDDTLLFADETPTTPETPAGRPWKIMIADDEAEVHHITRMVLGNFSFEDRPIELISTYSGRETQAAMAANPDTAILLLDVVMEEDQSGLAVVRHIRDVLQNPFVRIILRTGQPGQAPEQEVVTRYDINDYKEKTELTARKLITAVIAAMRAYRDLRIIDLNRRGLEKIIDASNRLFELQSLRKFSSGVLTQLTALLGIEDDTVYLRTSGFAAMQQGSDYCVLAGTGRFEGAIDKPVGNLLPPNVQGILAQGIPPRDGIYGDGFFLAKFPARNGADNLLYIESGRRLSDADRELIRVFSTNVAVAFDNVCLNQEIVDTQKEVVITLGEVVETRSKETVHHVRRVAEYAALLAQLAGLPEEEVELIRLAAPMHDVGKIGISDAILNKPGRLTPEEFDVMKTHAQIGYDILKTSSRPILKAAATIAHEHHERWDGAGYPRGIKEDATHIFSRICGLVDVFDALGHKRVYKDAWPEERIVAMFQEERGKAFDPALIDLWLANLDKVRAIQTLHAE